MYIRPIRKVNIKFVKVVMYGRATLTFAILALRHVTSKTCLLFRASARHIYASEGKS